MGCALWALCTESGVWLSAYEGCGICSGPVPSAGTDCNSSNRNCFYPTPMGCSSLAICTIANGSTKGTWTLEELCVAPK